MTALFILEWSAALLTIVGAWLLSGTGRRAPWGFVLFLGANGLWICFALRADLNGLFWQQVVLTVVSLRGIWRGLVEPWLDGVIEQLIEEQKS